MKKIKLLVVLLSSIFFLLSCGNESKVDIQMQSIGGVYQIPCKVNGVSMNFIFDTGASDVCISQTEASFLLKNGYIDSSDFGESAYSQIADGSVVENIHLNIDCIEVGGISINNVDAIVVSSMNAPLLLGQSAIQKLGRIEMHGNNLTIYRNGGHSGFQQNNDVGIVAKLQDLINNGWHYEGEVYSSQQHKLKLYSKSIGGALDYQVKDENKVIYHVILNPDFGEEKVKLEGKIVDNPSYEYKYTTDVHYGISYSFNMPGDDVKSELAAIKAKKWQYIKNVQLYYHGINTLDWKNGRLFFRECDNKYMVIPISQFSSNDNGMYVEPNDPRGIIVKEIDQYVYYEKIGFISKKPEVACKYFQYRASEYYLNF